MDSKDLVEKLRESATVYVAAEVCGIRLPAPGKRFRVPWREDRKPSASILPDQKRIHDFSRDEGRDAFGLVEELRGVSFPVAANLIADEMGFPMPFEDEMRFGHSKVLVEKLGRWPGEEEKVEVAPVAVRNSRCDGIANFRGGLRDNNAHEFIFATCQELAANSVDQLEISTWRGFPIEMVQSLAKEGRLGAARIEDGQLCVILPCAKNTEGLWVRAQVRVVGPRQDGCEWFWPAKSDHKPSPWVASEGLEGGRLIVGEGWGDAAAARLLADAPEARIVATLGTGCRGLAEMSPATEILLARQNETGDANAMWARRIHKSYGDKVTVRSVVPPKGVKDWNDALGKWGVDGGRELWAGAVQVDPDRLRLSVADVPMSDYGNSLLFANRWGDEIKFTAQLKSWNILAGNGLWKRDLTGEIVERGKILVDDLLAGPPVGKNDDDKKSKWNWTVKMGDRQKLLAMIDLAKSTPVIARKVGDWDLNVMLAGVSNGVLDLSTAQLLPDGLAEDALVTKQLGCAFNPQAKCPTWERFIDEVTLEDNELARFLQISAGYSLTGNTSAQHFWFLYGTGRNGKGVFMSTLEKLSGDYCKGADSVLISSRKTDSNLELKHALAALPGVRMLLGKETDDGESLNETMVKMITGEDSLVGEAKYCDAFTFKAICKIWLYGNYKPIIKGHDRGIWERVLPTPFLLDLPKEKRDEHLKEKLEEELPGILNWCLEGIRMWIENGRKIPIPKIVADAAEEYRVESDVLGDFIKDCCEPLSGFTVSKAELYKAYKRWAEESGHRVMSSHSLSRKLKDRRWEMSSKGYWSGWRLQTESETEMWSD
jgi:putative DNA primase/helicase